MLSSIALVVKVMAIAAQQQVDPLWLPRFRNLQRPSDLASDRNDNQYKLRIGYLTDKIVDHFILHALYLQQRVLVILGM